MFADYQKQVLLTYHEMKAANALSLSLIHTTPAKLREECIAVFTRRYDHHHDEKILRQFFGPHEDATTYLRAIRNFETDKFRPLDKFLKGSITETHDKNIELLAWLIDYKPRPYQWDRSYTSQEQTHDAHPRSLKTTEKDIIAQGADEQLSQETVAITPLKKNKKIKLKDSAIVLLLLIAGGASYWSWNRNNTPEQCMCWAGDHYQAISCKEKLGHADVYGMDSLQMIRFKKITRPDTLSQRSLGHVWYAKINGTVEFYTAGGNHPIHREKKLKPLTVYMLTKYAKPDQAVTAVNN